MIEQQTIEELQRRIAERFRQMDQLAAENEARRKLTLQLINAGYKAMALKLHPDVGGSTEAMAMLTRIRDALRRAYQPPKPYRRAKKGKAG